jgi:hypothetical protein
LYNVGRRDPTLQVLRYDTWNTVASGFHPRRKALPAGVGTLRDHYGFHEVDEEEDDLVGWL